MVHTSGARKSGFIKLIIIIVIGLIVLGYFGFDIQKIIDSPTVSKNLTYTKDLVVGVYQKYLARPLEYLWNKIFLNVLWAGFVNNMERIRDGEPSDIYKYAPKALPFPTS
ncbi:hypothetical protein EPO17_00315 [Patescibacteria group bacterium]|nr:MAG: hypothetical protein EPO17_00315 [Patescibacteria group bacterium]